MGTDSVLYKKLISAPAAPCYAIANFPFGGFDVTLDASGILYIIANHGSSGNRGLYSYDPSNGITTFHGSFPPALLVGEITFYKGKLYGNSCYNSCNNHCLSEINIAQPSLSTVYMNLTYQNAYNGIMSVPINCDSTDFYITFQSGSGPTHTWNYLRIDMANKVELGVVCSYPLAFGCSSLLPGGSFTHPIIDTIITQPTCSQTSNGAVSIAAHDPDRTLTYILNGVTNSSGTFNNLTPGNYNITVMNNLGCTKDTSFTIGASTYPSVAVNAVNLSSCITNDGTISITSLNNESLKYSINNSAYQPTNDFTNLSAGTYIVKALNTQGCAIADTVVITSPSINKSGISISTTDPVCSQKNGSIQIAVQNVITPVSFLLNSTSSSSGIFSGLGAAQYHLVVTDGKGCSLDTNILLKTFPVPHIDSIRLTGSCTSQGSNGAIFIFATHTNEVLSYTINNVTNNTGIFTGLAAGNYAVRISNQYGCYKDTSLQINDLAAPLFFATAINPNCLIKTGAIALKSLSNLKYSLNGGAYYAVDTIKNLAAGNYIITAINSDGCAASQNVVILSNPDSVCSSIYFPTAFTPNNDGLNDVFKPAVFGVLEKYHLIIYNRFGQKVFETVDYTNGWNGKINNVLANTAAYVWFSTYKFYGTNQTEHIAKGTFILIR